MNKEKFNKIERYLFLVLSTLVLYIILFLGKGFLFSFLNINTTSYIIDFEYQLLIITLSLIFFISMKNDENYKSRFINLPIGFLTISAYFVLSILEVPFLILFNINSTSPLYLKTIFMILYSIVMLIILILINYKSLKNDIVDIKKNHKKYFSKYIKYWFFAIIIMMFSNFIISLLNKGNIAGNEETIRTTLKAAPIYMIFSAIVFAPISEELVFRRSLKNIITSPTAFILTSGLIFGGLHVVSNINSWVDLLYLIPYSVHGLTFAYILSKTDNVLISMGLHFMHNGIIMSLEIFLLLLGVL